ncbi:tRNA (N(6)-L-threonylcarbamoyladenosine(37)-C(2))-methylthiotransferase MtaB [Pontiella sulfatireligans]|uniref:Threonylcarbamoyladenosine tRNA methylthiotransferase MtaB n=1 Tax=Pontiella sulfatireligans TaxID=2750658 RepID=A0A6C2UVD7_9BACT|nr:tRNA (N(6)-L-threonylcarbamoyladenosine(37)-C(2))-methylthiotransferase MtaB [Pontiella sulfatireligans]VGO23077.1 Threonylcarbamoyladenosine tRNA methylthiotransferase MtaB [Pontiella sulfatireligans]
MNAMKLETYLVNVLGCKVNQYDAQQIEQLLERYGLNKAEVTDEADVIVVHTCGVTAAAARKSRQTIRNMQRDNPLAHVIVTGCAANDDLTHVDQDPVFRVPAGADWLQRLAGQLDSLALPNPRAGEGIETDTFTISRFEGHTRAFLKVQDGCDIGCSFCIIPQLRKEPRDKAIDVAVREATVLTEAGYREIVVTGVSVGLYGRERGSSLAEMLRNLAAVPNIGRIRLSSLHPGELTDELLEVWASSPNIMPHLHLSLQSGSDVILHAMRRGYTADEYYDAVQRARAALDNPAFTTDVIVGFPGETDAYFDECYAFCQKVGFSQMHIFTYSPRPKTMAAKMGGQVNGALATARSERLHALGETLALNYHQPFIGRPVEVLVEGVKDGVAHGYSKHYIPVEFEAADVLRGQIAAIEATEATPLGISRLNRL